MRYQQKANQLIYKINWKAFLEQGRTKFVVDIDAQINLQILKDGSWTYVDVVVVVLVLGSELIVGPQSKVVNLRTLSKIHSLKKIQHLLLTIDRLLRTRLFPFLTTVIFLANKDSHNRSNQIVVPIFFPTRIYLLLSCVIF